MYQHTVSSAYKMESKEYNRYDANLGLKYQLEIDLDYNRVKPYIGNIKRKEFKVKNLETCKI